MTQKEGDKQSAKEIEYINEVFGYFEDGNGKLPPSDLVLIIRALGRNPDESTLREVCRELDASGYLASIDRPKFLAIWNKLTDRLDKGGRAAKEQEIKAAVKIFCRDDRGKVWLKDLENILSVVGVTIAPDEMERLESDLAPFCPALSVAGGTPASTVASASSSASLPAPLLAPGAAGPTAMPSTSMSGRLLSASAGPRDPWLPYTDLCDVLTIPYL